MATDFFKIGQAAYGGGADVSKAIGEGLKKGRQVFMAYLGEQKAKREKADALTKQYIARIPNVNAIDKIPEWMKGTVNSYLVSEKQKYVDLSKQLSTMSSSDPAYMDTVNALQKIQNNFVNLNDNLNQFQVDHKEYISDADQDIISLGFKEGQADNYTRLTKMYSGGLGLNIKDGQLIFNENGKNYNYSLGQIGGYFKKDSAPQTQLLKLENGLKQQAISGMDFKTAKSGYEGVITQLLNRGGKQGVLSMVFDTDVEFITGGKSLQTPEILEAISQERFETTIDADGNEIKGANALVKDQLMQGVEALHNSLYKAPESKITKEEEAKNRAIRAYNQIMRDPVKYVKTKLRGAFKGTQGGSKIILQIGEKDKTYDLVKPEQFQQFMDVVRENSKLFETESENAELTRAIFYDIVREESKKISEIQAGREKEQQAIIAKAVSPVISRVNTAISGVNLINTADLPIFK